MDVRWQDICEKLPLKKSKKLVRETVLAFYNAFESNIDTECNFSIFGVGNFKGTKRGLQRDRVRKAFNRHIAAYENKLIKRKQRYWAKEKIDDYWQTPNFK